MCLSYQGAYNTVNRICEDRDVEVQMWADNLLPVIDEPSSTVSTTKTGSVCMHVECTVQPQLSRPLCPPADPGIPDK